MAKPTGLEHATSDVAEADARNEIEEHAIFTNGLATCSDRACHKVTGVAAVRLRLAAVANFALSRARSG